MATPKLKLLKGINLISLLISVAWLSRAPSWESGIVFLGLLGALIAQEIRPDENQSIDKHDLDLFNKFLVEFPSNGRSARFLKEQDIEAVFRKSDLEEIDSFIKNWDNSDHEFTNKKLESLRANLLCKSQQFTRKLSPHIFSSDSEFYSSETSKHQPNPSKMKIFSELNKDASDLYKSHQELIRLGNKILKK